MSDLKICRICLRTNGKMYGFNEFLLKKYYEQIMVKKVREKDELPQRFCYECAALLYKFHKFKEKCHTGKKILEDTVKREAITYESIKRIDRHRNKLKSNLNLICVSDRVKTYRVKHKLIVPEPKIYEITLTPLENLDLDNQSESGFKDDDNNISFDAGYEINDNFETEVSKPAEDIFPAIKDAVIEDKISSDDEKLVIDLEKQEDNATELKNDTNAVTKTNLDDENMSSEDDKALIDLKKKSSVIKYVNSNIVQSLENLSDINKRKSPRKKETRRKKRKQQDCESKANKFRLETKKGKYLDSNNWLKIYLTEDEAEREFKARGEDRRYLNAPFKCTDCFKGFSQQDMLVRHTKLRHEESLGPIECRFCHMRFKWKCYLTRHMPRHYSIYKCLRCNLVCRMETSAIFHEDYHNGVIRKCKHCGEEFKHLSTYYTHLRTHRSQYVCNLCGVSFVSEAGLHLHKLVKHVGSAAPEACKRDAASGAYCSRCDIQFESRRAYEEHLFHSDMHSKGVEDLAEDTPPSACPKIRKKGMRTPRKPTTCGYCGKIFPTQSACMKHHHSEHPRTPFLPNEERHICEICGLSLAAVSVAHHLNTHTREKLFTCNTCGVQFNSKSSMNRHQLTHTGEKPYACSLCDKRFTQSNSVKLHYRTFHLKQPYPKRNRRKKTDEMVLAEDYRTDESESLTLDRWR